jgi:outer membrane beta-barrel protein
MKTFVPVCLLLALTSTTALAQQQASGEELVEKVVVRNRLYNVKGRFEVGANFGFSMLAKLVDHYNLNVSAGYNFMDALAAELRVGYAITQHTGLATDISEKFFAQSKTAVPNATDLTDLWEMNFNAIVGLRWQPVYGKLGLMAELPVHFQFYLWVGGGVAMLSRTSVVICNREGKNPETNKNACLQFLQGEDGTSPSRVGPLVSLAVGFRFFLTDNHVVRFEFRDWSWIDSYLENASRTGALQASNPTGNGTPVSSNITNLVQLDLGYTFIF